jgi:hypothetical protein
MNPDPDLTESSTNVEKRKILTFSFIHSTCHSTLFYLSHQLHTVIIFNIMDCKLKFSRKEYCLAFHLGYGPGKMMPIRPDPDTAFWAYSVFL